MAEETGSFLENQGVIRIDKEGAWYYNDLPIINKAIYLFFNKHVYQDDDGGYSLRVEGQTCRLVVEDTPYVVTGISLIPADLSSKSFFQLRLNDETEEPLDVETFYIGKDNIPYCRVKNGQFPARFLRAPYYHLAEHIHQENEDRFYFFLNGSKVYIPYRS